MKISKLIITALLILFIPTSALAGNKTYTKKTYKGIHFLDDVKKVEWYKVEGEHIIVGWKGLPDDFYTLNYQTALEASKLTRNKVYVLAVRYHQKDLVPGEGGQICISTAAKGVSVKTNCRK